MVILDSGWAAVLSDVIIGRENRVTDTQRKRQEDGVVWTRTSE